ncbi:hypothetical protein HOP50_06g41550 [Chloropicon primus]|nr:hypothetical protein HOP50_06g41550 [Chloropicon primus]
MTLMTKVRCVGHAGRALAPSLASSRTTASSARRTNVRYGNKSARTTTTRTTRTTTSSTSTSASGGGGLVASCPELEAIVKAEVVSCADESKTVTLGELWSQKDGERHVLVFLSHFGDLTSWEYAQKLRDNMDELVEKGGGGVSVIGLGSASNGRKFAELLDFPLANLYADSNGLLYKELGFAEGFLPDANVSPYVKLLGMLTGFGSPGTIQEVIRGYVGDRDSKQIFDSSLFNILGEGYQRPMELATLRLSNMIALGPLAPKGAPKSGVLPNWSELVSDEKLICQQGGTLAFSGAKLIHIQRDQGILKYADIDVLLEALDKEYQDVVEGLE